MKPWVSIQSHLDTPSLETCVIVYIVHHAINFMEVTFIEERHELTIQTLNVTCTHCCDRSGINPLDTSWPGAPEKWGRGYCKTPRLKFRKVIATITWCAHIKLTCRKKLICGYCKVTIRSHMITGHTSENGADINGWEWFTSTSLAV